MTEFAYPYNLRGKKVRVPRGALVCRQLRGERVPRWENLSKGTMATVYRVGPVCPGDTRKAVIWQSKGGETSCLVEQIELVDA